LQNAGIDQNIKEIVSSLLRRYFMTHPVFGKGSNLNDGCDNVYDVL
jgi:hypothetical protein